MSRKRGNAMRTCWRTIVMTSLLTVVALVTTGNAADDDAKMVAALDTEYQAAVKNNDVATMDRILDDNFSVVLGSGQRYTKADLLEAARTRRVQYEPQEDSDQTGR